MQPLREAWELTATPPNALAEPMGLAAATLVWHPATVPGTVAQAWQAAGLWHLDTPSSLHDRDFWYRTRIIGRGARQLRLHGLATLTEVWLDRHLAVRSTSMFEMQEVALELDGEIQLALCFRALRPFLETIKGRSRWRPRMVSPTSLRSVRTTLLGHMPGWCPPVHAVGPWRDVELIETTQAWRVCCSRLAATLDDGAGLLEVELTVATVGDADPIEAGWLEGAVVVVGGVEMPLLHEGPDRLRAVARVPGAAPWWPHTHGEPALHEVSARIGGVAVELGRVGFRTIVRDDGEDGRGFGLTINGVPVFCRGACWTTADIVSLAGDAASLRPWLELARDAGMNMLRVGGTMVYESDDFYALCDELGILVWQDFMLANFDYPAADAEFIRRLEREAAQFLGRTQTSPSLAVLCGGSEVAQQAAMLGLPPESWGGVIVDEILPALVARLRPDLVYVPNSPSGGAVPFAADTGIAHYYGVGAYLRPLDDARRAGVRFAAECLAFANVPDASTLAQHLPVPAVHHPAWKARVPRDAGAAWDFEDVRDHYLALLYGVELPRLRYDDPERYLELSRAVSVEVMEAVFAEWRRTGSRCAGGLVWFFQDLWAGAGWGVIDAQGVPKAAWYGLKHAFRPIQVLLLDEGVNGLVVHLINETARPVPARLDLRALHGGATPVVQAGIPVVLAPRQVTAMPAAGLIRRFFDFTYAYRFGPAAHDVTVAALLDEATGNRLADAFHFPHGRNVARCDLGLTAAVGKDDDGWTLTLRATRLATSVHVDDEHYQGSDAWFHLPPGIDRMLRLIPRDRSSAVPDGTVRALNGLTPTRYRAPR